jgi:bacillithiol system protein YtxJ
MAISWINLSEKEQVDDVIKGSSQKTVVFFKHSTRCIVSRHALAELEREWTYNSQDVDFYLLDLLSFRDISNYISQVLAIQHQSPQILVIRNAAVIYHTSHEGISASILNHKLIGK